MRYSHGCLLQSSNKAAKLFMAEGDVFGLGLVEAEDESAAAELARLRAVKQRFPPTEGSSLHLEALEGRCVGHSFTVDAASRLTITTKVPSSHSYLYNKYTLSLRISNAFFFVASC